MVHRWTSICSYGFCIEFIFCRPNIKSSSWMKWTPWAGQDRWLELRRCCRRNWLSSICMTEQHVLAQGPICLMLIGKSMHSCGTAKLGDIVIMVQCSTNQTYGFYSMTRLAKVCKIWHYPWMKNAGYKLSKCLLIPWYTINSCRK